MSLRAGFRDFVCIENLCNFAASKCKDMSVKPIIAPSLLSADFNRLGEEIEMLNRSEADWIHLDVMDGVFVPNISFGMPVIKAVRKLAQKPLDTHLMIVQPERYIQTFKEIGLTSDARIAVNR